MDNIKAFFIFLAILVIIVLIYPILKRPTHSIDNRQYIKVEPNKLNQKPEVKESSSKEIDKFFKDPVPCVPIDYPQKNIGECPYSKPLSMDLPVANSPMCFAKESKNMYLRIKNDNIQ